jgi:hypothetical protein
MAEIRINTTGGLKLYDADNSHYAQIVAGTITSNVDAITLGHDTVTIADNLSLGSDSAILKFGADTEIALTHVADTGLKLTDSGGTPTLQLHDANESIASDGSKVIITSGGTAFSLPTSDGSNGQVLSTNGSGVLSFATASSADPSSADGDSLGTASAEWSDLYLADGGIIYFGNDQDVTLTHVADTALLLNAAMRLQFRDSGLYIGSNADGDLDIVSDGTAADSINIESAGGITLDAGVAATGVTYEDDGTAMLSITNSSSDVVLTSKVQDKDIIFKGDDGGSAITALTIDMSDGGILQTRAGIGFPSTRVASTGVNVLDDYEEGEMASPIYIDNQQQTDYYSGRDKFSYIKIGRLVHCFGYVDTANQTLVDTGAVELALPFPVSAASSNVLNTGVAFLNGYLNNKYWATHIYLNADDTKSEINYAVGTSSENSAYYEGGAFSVLNTSHRLILTFSFTYNTDG